MTRPAQYLIRMVLFLAAVAAVCAPLFVPLRDAFMANAPLNGGILAVLVLLVAFRMALGLGWRPDEIYSVEPL